MRSIVDKINAYIKQQSLVTTESFIARDPYHWSEKTDYLYDLSKVYVIEAITSISKLKPGDICSIDFTNLNKNNYHSHRPGLIFQFENSPIIVMVIATCYENKHWDNYSENIEIIDWPQTGLAHKSYVSTDSFRTIDQVKIKYKIGKMSIQDYNRVYNQFVKNLDLKFSSPENFMRFLTNNNVKDSPETYIQSTESIETTFQASNMDITLTLHNICDKYKIEHIVVLYEFYNIHNKQNESYMMCLWKRGNNSYALRYDYNDCIASINKYTNDNDYVKAINGEASYIKKFYDKKFMSNSSVYLRVVSNEKFSILNKAYEERWDKNKLLNAIKVSIKTENKLFNIYNNVDINRMTSNILTNF